MWSRPPPRWLSASVSHSLWNLSCAAAEDSFHSPAQPKHQTMRRNGKCRHTLKKPLQWRASCMPVSIYYRIMAAGYHKKRIMQVAVKVFNPAKARRRSADSQELCSNSVRTKWRNREGCERAWEVSAEGLSDNETSWMNKRKETDKSGTRVQLLLHLRAHHGGLTSAAKE